MVCIQPNHAQHLTDPLLKTFVGYAFIIVRLLKWGDVLRNILHRTDL